MRTRWCDSRLAALAFFAASAATLPACPSTEPLVDDGTYEPKPLPALGEAPLTTALTVVPVRERLAEADPRKPSIPENLTLLLDEGFGETKDGPGEPFFPRTLDGSAPLPPGPKAKRLVRFAHLADFQIADDESPSRLMKFDAPPPLLDGAFRSHEAYGCHLVNALGRTVNRVHDDEPVDFVVLGGDNADNAQSNESDWVLDLLEGKTRVECDSGIDDDPVLGPDNDPKDPLLAIGLRMPWYWVTGNHDVLRQGNFPVTPEVIALSVGASAPGGTRDWAQPGGPITDEVIPDERRRALSASELYARVVARGDGHGMGQAQIDSGKATYTFDVEGTPLRFLIVDTAAETGGDKGLLRKQHVDDVIEPALAKAQADGKWVVLASHHELGLLGNGVGLGGSMQADAVLPADYLEVLGKYPNVILTLAGHSHVHDVHPLEAKSGHRFWEMVSGSLADFRHQSRLVEIWDQDNGQVLVRATSLDYRTDDDAIAAEGRAYSTADFMSGWGLDGNGTVEDHNVELILPKP